WAQREPSRMSRLVLVGTTPRFVAGEDWPHAMARETLRRFGDELRLSYRLTLQRFLTLQMRGSEEGEAALPMLRRHLFERGEPLPQVMAGALDVLAGIDLRDDVPGIDVPALVISGDRDTLAPVEAGRWLAQALPDARFAPIAGAAHVAFLSHPRAFDAA